MLNTSSFTCDAAGKLKLISGLLKPEAITELTRKQKADYKKFSYQCYDKIHVLGDTPMMRGNLLLVNGNEVKLGDSLFLLFLRLVVQLKRKKGRWVDRYTLGSEGVISDAETFQVYSNLRTALVGSLLEKDGQRFIESDG